MARILKDSAFTFNENKYLTSLYLPAAIKKSHVVTHLTRYCLAALTFLN